MLSDNLKNAGLSETLKQNFEMILVCFTLENKQTDKRTSPTVNAFFLVWKGLVPFQNSYQKSADKRKKNKEK